MLTPAKKRYLLCIYEIGLEGKKVRSVDISNSICISKACVATMLPLLCEDMLIEKKKDRTIELTDKGAIIARRLYKGYVSLINILVSYLNSTEENAKYDAVNCVCNMTDENIENIICYVEGSAVR